MTRYSIHTLQTATDRSKPFLEKVNRMFGFVPNLMGVLAESPAAIEAYLSLSEIFGRSGLSPAEQQVVLLTVSTENGCEYCVAAHTAAARMAKLPDDVISALRDATPITDPRLAALHRLTSKIVRQRGWLDDRDITELIDAGYSKRHVFDVIVGVTQKTLSNYVNHIAGTPLDAAFEAAAWEKKSSTAA